MRDCYLLKLVKWKTSGYNMNGFNLILYCQINKNEWMFGAIMSSFYVILFVCYILFFGFWYFMCRGGKPISDILRHLNIIN